MTDETIFAAAVEQPSPTERAAFLDTACGAETAQRKRIEALLAAHDKAGRFLERPAVAPPVLDHSATRAYAASSDGPTGIHGEVIADDEKDALGFLEPPGRPDSLGRIGHYEVLEVLGHGGFGIVYRAFDDVLQRVVAVKVLAPSLATTSPARKRFLREARAAGAVQHENIVRIHAIEEQPLPHLVMEFIPGETLQQRLDRTGPIDVAEVVRVGRQVAEGLSAAHANGLIHRDIKPSNILVDASPDARIKITDFGLARAADDASLTRSGTVAGTPMYMAPEQAKGEALDHRADLFSLGSVLYVMCSGRPPFRANSTLAVLKRVADEDPRPIREIIPEVPEWLCRIVEKLHAKDPAERFQTAKEVADVLADCEKQLAAHKEVKDTSRIPEAKTKPRTQYLRILVSFGIPLLLFAMLTLAVWAGPYTVLYPANLGRITLVGPFDPDLNSLQVRRVGDGELMAMLDPSNLQIKLPPGEYELDAICVPGYEVTKYHVESTLLRTVSSSFERIEDRPAIRLTLRRGEATTVAATVEKRAGLSPSPSQLSPNESWVQLFKGKDLTGWSPSPNSPGRWQVEGGELVGTHGPGYLFGAKSYENFHLRAEAKINAAGNSGIAFRRTFQVELFDDPECPTGTILQVAPGKTTPLARYPNPALVDAWFTLEIRADGPTLAVRIGEGPWVTAQDTRADGTRSGPLQLEVFGPNTVVRFRKIEIKELPSASPARGGPAEAVLLKSFDPAKDKAVPVRGDPKKIISVEDGAWRIVNQDEGGNFRVALATITEGIPEDGILICRCKVKLQPKHKDAWGDLELTTAAPSSYGYDWPKHLAEYRGEITEWTAKEVRYPVEVFRKKNLPAVPIYVGLHADGVLWVKDLELLHLPSPKQASPAKANPAVLQPLHDAVTAKTRTLETTKTRYEVGLVSKIDVLNAEAELTDSRIALAEAEGDTKAVVARLEELVRQRQAERDLIAVRVNGGADRPDVLDRADTRLANAKVRLAKVKP